MNLPATTKYTDYVGVLKWWSRTSHISFSSNNFVESISGIKLIYEDYLTSISDYTMTGIAGKYQHSFIRIMFAEFVEFDDIVQVLFDWKVK